MTAPASMWTQLRQIFDEMAETFATADLSRAATGRGQYQPVACS